MSTSFQVLLTFSRHCSKTTSVVQFLGTRLSETAVLAFTREVVEVV